MNIKEDKFWTDIRQKFEWTMTDSETDKYKINVFDDGNEQYKEYKNEWQIYGYWQEKVALSNIHNQDIKIGSISKWKIHSLTV